MPFQVFLVASGVKRIVAHTLQGFVGFLPRRLDCTAALAAGILTYETEENGEAYLAVDQGILVKSGLDVIVSVRSAIGGTDLDQLHEAVKREFLQIDQQERNVREALAKMESGFIHRLEELQHE
ncbi:MAG: F0F1 ATP synthase subunit epsilon [Planctomycetales bacterium]|nr:F0F1 ATP synthase subunit epsilon [Planctomycetales bacterium]